MDGAEFDEVVRAARELLAAGHSPVDAVAEIVGLGAEPNGATIAVCVAAGSTRADAEANYECVRGIWEEIEPGEERDAAELIASHGCFEVSVELGPRELEVLALLREAFRITGGLAPAIAIGLFTDFRTGRLARAFLKFERFGPKRGDPAQYWGVMSRVGDALANGDAELEAARQRCHDRLASLGEDGR